MKSKPEMVMGERCLETKELADSRSRLAGTVMDYLPPYAIVDIERFVLAMIENQNYRDAIGKVIIDETHFD